MAMYSAEDVYLTQNPWSRETANFKSGTERFPRSDKNTVPSPQEYAPTTSTFSLPKSSSTGNFRSGSPRLPSYKASCPPSTAYNPHDHRSIGGERSNGGMPSPQFRSGSARLQTPKPEAPPATAYFPTDPSASGTDYRKGTSMFRSTSARLPDASTAAPGPASYSPLPSEPKAAGPASVFRSTAPRFQDPSTDTPAPGEYTPEESGPPQAGSSVFRSRSPRLPESKSRTKDIGSPDYHTIGAKASRTKASGSSMFRSNVSRLESPKSVTPGPGSYGPPLSKSNRARSRSPCGFGASSSRFQEPHGSRTAEQPAPGSYDSRSLPSRSSNPSLSQRSKRFEGGEKHVPGPGMYNCNYSTFHSQPFALSRTGKAARRG